MLLYFESKECKAPGPCKTSPLSSLLSDLRALLATLLQTDIMDLLGSDLPVESDEGMQFAWSDGILLQVDLSTNISTLFFSYFLKCFRCGCSNCFRL